MTIDILNGLSAFSFTSLVLLAGFTSMLTAALGAGGGIMLLGAMAQIVPPSVIIPLHGVVQLGSNANRAAMCWRDIDWQLILTLIPGAIVGSILGSFVLMALPPAVMYLTIASFILYLCWGPKIPKIILGKWGLIAAGTVTTFLTLFVGATGPLVAGFINQLYKERFRTVATFAAIMSLQHICKITVFGLNGFKLMPWLPLIGLMIAAGAIGTWIGLKLLKRMQDHHFQKILNLILTLLAVRLIYQAFTNM